MLKIADNKTADVDELKTRLIDEWAQFDGRGISFFKIRPELQFNVLVYILKSGISQE